MREVEKKTKNCAVKEDVDIADFRPSLRLPAHLHVHLLDSVIHSPLPLSVGNDLSALPISYATILTAINFYFSAAYIY